MARIISSNSLSNIGSSPRLDRAKAEVQIADKNKSYYDAFIRATSAPTVLCTYYSIDDSTSYSESTKNIRLTHNVKKFVRISDFVMYNYDSEDLEDKTDSERRLSIDLAPKSSFLEPGSILPKEGDHIVLRSQGAIAKPYMVTKVTPLKFLDKEVWNIDYSESTEFTIPELDANTVEKKVFVRNSGNGGNSLINEELKSSVDIANIVIDKLSTKYTELFYDVFMDALVYVPHNNSKIHLNYYAISRFQELHSVLKYGYDKNTLFIQNTYGFDAIEENFDKSLYGSLIDRWFEPREEYCGEESTDNETTHAAHAIKCAMDLREHIFAEYRGFPHKYESRYVYETRLHPRSKEDHMILTRYYNSRIKLIDTFDTGGFVDKRLRDSWINYQLISPVICPALDMFMDGEWEEIIKYCNKLKRFNPSKLCIDDYIGVPLLIYVIREAINNLTKDDNHGTYK